MKTGITETGTRIEIGRIVRKHRERLKMTQLEVSTALGYDSMQFVSLFERGFSKIPLNKLGELFELFKLSKRQRSEITNIIEESYKNVVNSEIHAGIREYNYRIGSKK